MTIKEIETIVNHSGTKQYRVSIIGGKSKVVRLWLHSDGCVCIITKGRRHYGHHLSSWDGIEDWVTLKLVESKQSDKVKLVKKRAQDALKYLTASGFWVDIKKEIEYFLENVDIEEFCKDMEKGSYENFYCQRGEGKKYAWCGTYQVFESFYSKRCWKSIAYDKWNRQRYNEEVQRAINEKKDYSRRWTNGYDNTLELRFDKDCPRGWYSEEYRNCGNGHYYLLFDATHAIFYGDD